VGQYIAKAVRCFAFGIPEPLVDGVSGRVLRRLFGVEEVGEPARDRRVWELARAMVGRSTAKYVNWALLDLASDVCKPKRPRCWQCPVARDCAWAAEHYWPSVGPWRPQGSGRQA
jgi:A/G-specific adenine glycosylase